MSRFSRFGTMLAIIAVAGLGVIAMPGKAEAWWRGGWWCCRVGIGITVPPVVVAPPVYAPPVYYAPPPAYYAPPQRIWVPPHWQGNVWVPGYWS